MMMVDERTFWIFYLYIPRRILLSFIILSLIIQLINTRLINLAFRFLSRQYYSIRLFFEILKLFFR